MSVLAVALVACAGILSVPCLVLLVECLAARRALRPGVPGPAVAIRTTVIIPAHDEELGIGATVESLRAQLAAGDTVVVVADNCTDTTAEVARRAGATVLERHDTALRGKGHAITFAVAALRKSPPDVVVLVDADCRVAPADGVQRLARAAASAGRPIQAEYLLGTSASPNARQVVSALAILVRNRVRPRGMHRLGLPCQLTGSGMAFPWALLEAAPSGESNLVEDLVLGLELSLRGTPPLLCPEVSISSELPEGDQPLFKQRRRWEHGQLSTLLAFGPRLVLAGLARARLGLQALGLDLLVPPLALLVMLLCGLATLSGAAAILGQGYVPLAASGALLGCVALAVGRAWWSFARDTVPLSALLSAPLYVAWKVPLYVGLLVRGKHAAWERTARKGESERSSDSTDLGNGEPGTGNREPGTGNVRT
jgi:cellulose synthase/poly-beta-1,6-N-acetylglucosamine synthase-like glycosyltransferase